ncbi:MAG: flagellar basal-body rod protein FlgB [Desulfobacteraceae bacterium 4572_130]|nr:MAG: flagellar basal-body rod protein FlgB [Desulfobacteraceae bacterium 4572_130]
MGDSRVFNRTYDVISHALDISARRHNLITGNIANMDTIKYVPKDIDFKKALKRAIGEEKPQKIACTHDKHFSGVKADFFSINGKFSDDVDLEHLDPVDIDTEMSNLIQNNIKYTTTSEMLIRKMTILRHAIQEGGR